MKKTLFDTAKLANQDLHYKFLWTSQGQIRLRQKHIAKSLLCPHYLTCTGLGIPALLLEKLGRSVKCAHLLHFSSIILH